MTAAISLQAVLARFMGKQRLSPRQGQVVSHIQACRTEALGGQVLHCNRCEYAKVHYRACEAAIVRTVSTAPPGAGVHANNRRCCR